VTTTPFSLPNLILQKDIISHQETILGNMAAKGEAETATPAKWQIKWSNVILLTVIHLLAIYGFIVVVPRIKLATFIWSKWHLYGYHIFWGPTKDIFAINSQLLNFSFLGSY
jgi:hypothetical protein